MEILGSYKYSSSSSGLEGPVILSTSKITNGLDILGFDMWLKPWD